MTVSGKTIVVTGSSSGIGAETVRILKANGARVIGLDRVVYNAVEVDKFIHVDLADPTSIDFAMSEMNEKVDGLCNVAGIPPTLPEVLVLQVNFFGLRYLTQVMLDHLNDGASIVNVASMAGFGWQKNIDQVKSLMALNGFDDVAGFVEAEKIVGAKSYMLSKEALVAWTHKNWDKWMDRDIRMNTVSPGPADTPILEDFIASLGKRADDDLNTLRAGTVEEIAPLIAFLCSDDSRWVRGANMTVDGGLAASALTEMHGL